MILRVLDVIDTFCYQNINMTCLKNM